MHTCSCEPFHPKIDICDKLIKNKCAHKRNDPFSRDKLLLDSLDPRKADVVTHYLENKIYKITRYLAGALQMNNHSYINNIIEPFTMT